MKVTHTFSLIPRPHPACMCISLHCVILKAIHTGAGFRSGIETENILATKKRVDMKVDVIPIILQKMHFKGMVKS